MSPEWLFSALCAVGFRPTREFIEPPKIGPAKAHKPSEICAEIQRVISCEPVGRPTESRTTKAAARPMGRAMAQPVARTMGQREERPLGRYVSAVLSHGLSDDVREVLEGLRLLQCERDLYNRVLRETGRTVSYWARSVEGLPRLDALSVLYEQTGLSTSDCSWIERTAKRRGPIYHRAPTAPHGAPPKSKKLSKKASTSSTCGVPPREAISSFFETVKADLTEWVPMRSLVERYAQAGLPPVSGVVFSREIVALGCEKKQFDERRRGGRRVSKVRIKRGRR